MTRLLCRKGPGTVRYETIKMQLLTEYIKRAVICWTRFWNRSYSQVMNCNYDNEKHEKKYIFCK